MKLSKNLHTASAEADLTPMIDMVFQLVAFFMVLLNFSQSEQNDKVILPESELAKPVDAPIEYPIILHLTNEGTVVVGGDEISIEALRTRLAPEVDLLKLDGKSAQDANIIIRGHENVAGGRVQDLINKCQEVGFEKFALRVKEKL
jgi:biopolymer transport protein ExbD